MDEETSENGKRVNLHVEVFGDIFQESKDLAALGRTKNSKRSIRARDAGV